MERLTKWLDDKKALCIEVCEKECTEGYYECPKCKPFTDVLVKLAHYEDLEEQGLLLKLPCKVGDKAYHVIEDNIANPPIYISEHEIQDVSAKSVYFADDWWSFEEMREMNAFLNKEEAEAKLKELGDK